MSEIVFGFMAPPLSEQLVDCGIPEDELAHADLDAKAVLRLHVRGIITDGERHRAFQRLTKALEKAARAKRQSNG